MERPSYAQSPQAGILFAFTSIENRPVAFLFGVSPLIGAIIPGRCGACGKRSPSNALWEVLGEAPIVLCPPCYDFHCAIHPVVVHRKLQSAIRSTNSEMTPKGIPPPPPRCHSERSEESIFPLPITEEGQACPERSRRDEDICPLRSEPVKDRRIGADEYFEKWRKVA